MRTQLNQIPGFQAGVEPRPLDLRTVTPAAGVAVQPTAVFTARTAPDALGTDRRRRPHLE